MLYNHYDQLQMYILCITQSNRIIIFPVLICETLKCLWGLLFFHMGFLSPSFCLVSFLLFSELVYIVFLPFQSIFSFSHFSGLRIYSTLIVMQISPRLFPHADFFVLGAISNRFEIICHHNQVFLIIKSRKDQTETSPFLGGVWKRNLIL